MTKRLKSKLDEAGSNTPVSEIVIHWIERHCRVPDGKHCGEPLRLLPFQKDFLRLVYDNPAGTRTAILSIPRKNGKTVLSAAMMLYHLLGPGAVRNSQLYSTANDHKQASIVFEAACKMCLMSPTLVRWIEITDSRKTIRCKELGTVYRSLSSDSKGAHGLSPIFTIHDEVGQVRGPKSRLIEAISTASSAHENPLEIFISTQAETDSDLFSIMIDGALTGADPRKVCMVFSAPTDMDPYSDEALIAANPSWSFMNHAELRNLALSAKTIPSFSAAFKNLNLNQRISSVPSFISPEVWNANAAHPLPYEGKDVVVGLDLSSVNDLTAMTVGHIDNGEISLHSFCWLPNSGIEAKSEADHIDWTIWRDRGLLLTTPGRTIDYMFVAAKLLEIVKNTKSCIVRFDPHMGQEFRRCLPHAGFSDEWIENNMIPHRQGFLSMAEPINCFEKKILDHAIRHGGHPILSMCMSNAQVIRDSSNSRKLTKSTESRKIDLAITSTMVVGHLVSYDNGKETSYLESGDLLVF